MKELKELGVAGSATNEWGRYGNGLALFEEGFSYLPLFVPRKMLQVTNNQELLQVTSKDRYTQRLLHVASKDCCRLTCNRLLSVT